MSLSKKQFNALKQSEKNALISVAQKGAKKRRRARRPRVNLPQSMPPQRNAMGRRRGQKRQRGGRGVTTAGNMRSFVVPIDEQISLINGSTGFQVTPITVNPGNPLFLPFMSRTAQNYERYEFLDLEFHYKPSASVFATVGAQGFVGISATMDAAQAPPSNQAQAEILHHSQIVETAKICSLKLPKSFLQSKSLREQFFVEQNGTVPGGSDPHTYICAQAFVWTNGQANTNQIGEVRVTGKLRLTNPALEQSLAFQPNYNAAMFSITSVVPAASGTPANVPFTNTNTGAITGVVNGLGITLSGGAMTLPPGNYIYVFTSDLDNSSNTNTIWTVTANASVNGGAFSNVSPSISCSVGAITGVFQHNPVAITGFIASNGSTILQFIGNAIYGAGAADIDASVVIFAI